MNRCGASPGCRGRGDGAQVAPLGGGVPPSPWRASLNRLRFFM
jgi:hypothetical protein